MKSNKIMEINTKTIALMKRKYGLETFMEETLTNDTEYEKFDLNIESMNIFFTEAWNGKEKILKVSVGWNYLYQAELLKQFLCNTDGFEKACNWVDEKRIEFAERLLV